MKWRKRGGADAFMKRWRHGGRQAGIWRQEAAAKWRRAERYHLAVRQRQHDDVVHAQYEGTGQHERTRWQHRARVVST